MNLIEQKEKDKIAEIAGQLSNLVSYKKLIFTEVLEEQESYWIDSDEVQENDFEKYDFQTPVQLKEHLRQQWKSELHDAEQAEIWEHILDVIAVWTFKKKPDEITVKLSEDKPGMAKEQVHLPDFVYRF